MGVILRLSWFFCISCVAGQAVDQTLIPETRGKYVVDAVVNRIQDSVIFPDDNSLLRRIAYVESSDGEDADTYRNGYDGGIWQMDLTRFQSTSDINSHSDLQTKHEKIMQAFNIDWLNVQWVDLRKPFYSGLAARLYLSNNATPIPLASDIIAQAYYWKDYFHSSGGGTVQKFVDNVTELERNKVCRKGIDLIFVLDSSGSVGAENFELVRNFTANVIKQLDIGSEKSRVGLIRYSTDAHVLFSLNTYLTNVSLLEAVASMSYNGGWTNTPAALNATIEQFSTEYGARSKALGIPRIVVVVTDGQSNRGGGPPGTIAAANRAHSQGILGYGVGVGNNINMEELNAIASGPEYVRLLSTFDIVELKAFQESLNRDSCTAPAISDPGQQITGLLTQGEVTFLQMSLPDDGLTITIDVNEGSVVMYGSDKIQQPNEAFHDFKLTNEKPEIYLTEEIFGKNTSTIVSKREATTDSTGITIYISIEGQSMVNNFTLNTSIGDTTSDIDIITTSSVIPFPNTSTIPSTSIIKPKYIPATSVVAVATPAPTLTAIPTSDPREAILIGVSIALAGLVITVLVAVIIGVLCVSSRAQKSMMV